MVQLWASNDNRVLVVDQVVFPEDTAQDPKSDLDGLFSSGAWIILWRREGGDRWHFTRNRRYAKPSLGSLRRDLHANDDSAIANQIWIAANDAHGHLYAEADVSPEEIARALYYAWQRLAATELPKKIAFRGLDAAAPDLTKLSVWLHPGLETYAYDLTQRQALLAELYEEAA